MPPTPELILNQILHFASHWMATKILALVPALECEAYNVLLWEYRIGNRFLFPLSAGPLVLCSGSWYFHCLLWQESDWEISFIMFISAVQLTSPLTRHRGQRQVFYTKGVSQISWCTILGESTYHHHLVPSAFTNKIVFINRRLNLTNKPPNFRK